MSQKGEFTFLHKTVPLGWPPQWERADAEDRLWCYNLHYHDCIWGLPFEKAQVLATAWIDACTFRCGSVAWKAYPISVRLGNWLKYFFCSHAERCRAEPEFSEKLLTSITVQATWLLKNLEIHLLGNHLLENAVALCLIGALFDGPLAETCARRGSDLLRSELDEQILSDGGHFERSPMYHTRCLYLLADLYNLGMDGMIPQLTDYLLRMWKWLHCMCHPDGEIALFNDAAHNVYLSPAALSGYLSRLLQRDVLRQSGAFGLSDSGYFGWIGKDGEYVACDAGPIGPDYQPGHAHADLFSFEVSLNGRRIIVDSGTSTYSAGTEREYLRGTAAHNTMEVDGRNQVDTWRSFRVGQRARPYGVHFDRSPDGFVLSASHSAYRHKCGIVHRRTFAFTSGQGLRITDVLQGGAGYRVHTRIHFAPDCVVKLADACCTVTSQATSLRITYDGYTSSAVDSAPVSRELGKAEAAHCLVLAPPPGCIVCNTMISW